MDEMVEEVLSLCPGCDPEEVKRDLNTTGDIEMTINHVLDGMLSPKSNPVTIVMNDDVMVMSSSKFTNIKERSQNGTNTSCSDDMKTQAKQECNLQTGNKNKHKISLDLSDSDPELTEASEACKTTLERLKSNIINLEASTSKISKDACNVESGPSSPDSDSELLKPAFDYNHAQKASTSAAAKRTKPVDMLETVVGRSVDSCWGDSTGHRGVNVGGFKASSKVIDEDVCLEVPEKKRKRTKEEIEQRKQEASLKKAVKEKERQKKLEEKKRQKDVRAAAMQEKKLKKEKDQLQRKAERLTKSANKLDGCMKFITVSLDPAVFSEETPDPNTNLILQKLISMEANYVIASQPYRGSVSWQRTSVQHSVQESELKIMTSDCRKDENEVLIVLSAERFAEMIFSFKQGYTGGYDRLDERLETLVDFTKYVKNIYHGKKVTFLISGLEKYMRDVKLKQRRAFRNAAVDEPAVEEGTRKRRKKKTLAVLDVTRTDIEEALVDLQLKTNVCVYQCETYEDLALKIAVFTKAIAEKPYKKCLTDGLGFCLDRLDKTSLKVSKDGQGMVNVWQQQIQQFRNVSREMAAAIVTEYPSPQLLKQTYEQCQSVQDAMLLLEDILVRRGGGSLATCRRIGPELSKRFYILFHSKENSDLVKG